MIFWKQKTLISKKLNILPKNLYLLKYYILTLLNKYYTITRWLCFCGFLWPLSIWAVSIVQSVIFCEIFSFSSGFSGLEQWDTIESWSWSNYIFRSGDCYMQLCNNRSSLFYQILSSCVLLLILEVIIYFPLDVFVKVKFLNAKWLW